LIDPGSRQVRHKFDTTPQKVGESGLTISDSSGLATRRALYPPIEPHEHGRLPVGDGHDVYWEMREP